MKVRKSHITSHPLKINVFLCVCRLSVKNWKIENRKIENRKKSKNWKFSKSKNFKTWSKPSKLWG